MDKRKLYKKAIEKDGVNFNMRMLMEECGELTQAANKYLRYGNDKILEEIADVEIMIEIVRLILGNGANKMISLHKKDKLERLENRLK